jgi:phage tail protein X
MAVITYENVRVRSDGISLDLIVWQRFRRPMPGLVESILALPVNQHLESAPFVLPLGTEVTIPIESRPAAQTVSVVSLWD